MEKMCTHDGCERPHSAKGYCNLHYSRKLRGGDMDAPARGPQGQTIEEFFWSRVAKTETCWLWTGKKTTLGYGQIRYHGKTNYAYRYAWELMVGPIEPGDYIDHLCHVPGCVNPSHLRPATPKQNMENRKGANLNSKTGIRGVYWDERKQLYIAQVRHKGKVAYRCGFKTLEEAQDAVSAARRTLYLEAGGD